MNDRFMPSFYQHLFRILGASFATVLVVLKPLAASSTPAMFVAIQGRGIALVRDQRFADVKPDVHTLTFVNLSAQLRPETLWVRPLAVDKDFRVIYENFQAELPSYATMLRSMVGKTIKYVESDPDLGREVHRQGRLLAIDDDGMVIQTDRRIETHVQARVQFDQLPELVAPEPSVTLTVAAEKAATIPFELSYLTSGLDWSAQYQAHVHDADDYIDFYGYVTVKNGTNLSLQNATLDVMAAATSKVSSEARAAERVVAEITAAEKQAGVRPTALVDTKTLSAVPLPARIEEYFGQNFTETSRFNLGVGLSLMPLETKRFVYVKASKIRGQRQYWARVTNDPFVDENSTEVSIPVLSVISCANRKGVLGGQPLPEGTLTVLRRSAQGVSLLQDVSKVSETAVGAQLAMPLGKAEGISATLTQSDFKRLGDRVVETGYRVDVRNTRKQAAQVKIVVSVPRDAQILRETHPHTQPGPQSWVWTLDIPPNNQAELRYRLRATQS